MKSILTVALDDEIFERLAPLQRRESLSVHIKFESGCREALIQWSEAETT